MSVMYANTSKEILIEIAKERLLLNRRRYHSLTKEDIQTYEFENGNILIWIGNEEHPAADYTFSREMDYLCGHPVFGDWHIGSIDYDSSMIFLIVENGAIYTGDCVYNAITEMLEQMLEEEQRNECGME